MPPPRSRKFTTYLPDKTMHEHFGILLVLGICAFLGMICAGFFQKIKVPQVVGYIVIGLIIGETGLGIVDKQHIATLQPLVYFSLGVIGMLVGSGLGVVITLLLKKATRIPVTISWESFALSLAFALLVGTFFGVQPARKAASLDPVETLR